MNIISSGIEAKQGLNGDILLYAKQLLKDENLLRYAKPMWTQTTQKMIDDSNIIVFLNEDVYEDAVKLFKIPAGK